MTMSELIIVNGPPGVGKSTVTAILRMLVPGTVAISGDELRAFAPPDARAHLGGGATYRAGGALSAAFLELGAARVIFDYVFLRAAHFRYFLDALPETPARIITLWAPLETLVARELARSGRQRLGLAVRDCYQEMSQNLAQMGLIVDNDALTPEATAERVHELLANAARH
jgi:chloramphenicol 3-O-phosphotransferase